MIFYYKTSKRKDKWSIVKKTMLAPKALNIFKSRTMIQIQTLIRGDLHTIRS